MPRPPLSTLFPYTTLFRSLRSVLRDRHSPRGTTVEKERAETWWGGSPSHTCQAVLKGLPKRLGKYGDRKSTRLNSSHTVISYAVFCLKKKKKKKYTKQSNENRTHRIRYIR